MFDHSKKPTNPKPKPKPKQCPLEKKKDKKQCIAAFVTCAKLKYITAREQKL